MSPRNPVNRRGAAPKVRMQKPVPAQARQQTNRADPSDRRGSAMTASMLSPITRTTEASITTAVPGAPADPFDVDLTIVTEVGASRYAAHMIRAVVFDVGECLVDETREYGTWADWLGVPRHTFHAMFGAVIAQGRDYRETFLEFRPSFDLY